MGFIEPPGFNPSFDILSASERLGSQGLVVSNAAVNSKGRIVSDIYFIPPQLGEVFAH